MSVVIHKPQYISRGRMLLTRVDSRDGRRENFYYYLPAGKVKREHFEKAQQMVVNAVSHNDES